MITLAQARTHVGKADQRVWEADRRKPLLPRLLARSEWDGAGCLVWTGAKINGYGVIRLGTGLGNALTHRVAYLLQRGPIPAGMELDHLCRNRPCMNLADLEVVTHRENGMRGLKGALVVPKTHCPAQHDYAIWGRKNTLGYTYCQACKAAGQRRHRARSRSC